MNWRGVIATWWYWIVGAAAIIAISIPLLTAPTEEDPTGQAGLFAPVVALFTAAMIISQSASAGWLRNRLLPGISSVAPALTYGWLMLLTSPTRPNAANRSGSSTDYGNPNDDHSTAATAPSFPVPPPSASAMKE